MARNQWPRYGIPIWEILLVCTVFTNLQYCVGHANHKKAEVDDCRSRLQRAMGKRKRGGGFEVVPVGFSRGGGEHGGAKSSGKSNLNTLRQAHSSAMRKKEESMHTLPECMSCGKLPHTLSSGPCLHHVHVFW